MRHCVGAWFACALLIGCYASHERRDAECVPVPAADAGTITPEKVDLLLMVDNSNSMSEEQASLVTELPNLVRALATGDVDFDGVVDFAPVGSLHVGVVTSDMGVGGHTVPTCGAADFGDDGILRRRGEASREGCDALGPAFLTYRAEDDGTPDEFAEQVECVAVAGTGGCGFEQQLEAALKAVTPSSSPIRFFQNTRGHGDGENDGFLRPDSILAIVMVTDENDCSAADPDIFNPGSATYGATDLNLRCWAHGEMALHPIERYVDGLLALRSREPGRLVFANIVGIPIDLSGAPASTILADPRMAEIVDPAASTRLIPSCDIPERGVAFPPTRLVQTAEGIRRAGGRAVNLSICQESFSPAVAVVLEEIAAAARPLCR